MIKYWNESSFDILLISLNVAITNIKFYYYKL